jgi:protein-S-isoprenylcysteine O-methyltransferase Ste14
MNPLDVAQPWTACALSLILVGLVIRGWSAGTLNKSRELTQHGPYAVVRNPLYLGSFLMMLGFCILCRDALTLAFVAGPMAVLYWNQIHFEERRLAGMFPEQWQSYVRRVPRLIPQLSARGVIGGWEWAQWKRNREYQAVLASTLGLFGIYAWHWFVVN